MRNLYEPEVNRHRCNGAETIAHYGNTGDETCGMFDVPSCIDRKPLRVVASCGAGWDHVSVSRINRCPTWPEMEQIKRLFFRPHETAMQLHVAESEHISVHPHCLHIWRPHEAQIPLPPRWTVA